MALNMWKWLAAFAAGCGLLWLWMFREHSGGGAIRPRAMNKMPQLRGDDRQRDESRHRSATTAANSGFAGACRVECVRRASP